MVVLRFITVGDGAQCAMICGISRMLMWCVVSLASIKHPALLGGQSTVKGLVLPGWMTLVVKDTRYRYYTVLTMDGDLRTAVIARMQVWSV